MQVIKTFDYQYQTAYQHAVLNMVKDYAKSVLSREISFDRAVKKMHFTSQIDNHLLEELLIESIRESCPLK